MNNGIFVQDIYSKIGFDKKIPYGIDGTPLPVRLPYHIFGPDWQINDRNFIIVVDTSFIVSDTIGILLAGNGFRFTVNWGDGVIETYPSYNNTSIPHTYSAKGIYTIQIFGGIYAPRLSSSPALIKIVSFGDMTANANYTQAFRFNTNLIELPKKIPNTSNVNIVQAFLGCSKLNDPNIANWNTSNIGSIDNTFNGCLLFNQNLGSWDTSNFTNMGGAFQGASAFDNLGSDSINYWDVGNVTNTSFMFNDARAFNQPLNNWDTRKVINFNSMFQGATSFNSSLSGWELGLDTAATTCGNMFQGATNFNQDIGNWNTSKVTNMGGMFTLATNFNQDIGGWNVSNVTNFAFMFWAFPVVLSFNFNLGSWDVSKATTLQEMFRGCISVSNQDLRNWNLARINVSNGLDNFMLGATGANSMTTANYDALLIGWNNNKLASANGIANWRTDLRPNFGGAKYTAGGAAAAARAALVSYGWTITDGGTA